MTTTTSRAERDPKRFGRSAIAILLIGTMACAGQVIEDPNGSEAASVQGADDWRFAGAPLDHLSESQLAEQNCMAARLWAARHEYIAPTLAALGVSESTLRRAGEAKRSAARELCAPPSSDPAEMTRATIAALRPASDLGLDALNEIAGKWGLSGEQAFAVAVRHLEVDEGRLEDHCGMPTATGGGLEAAAPETFGSMDLEGAPYGASCSGQSPDETRAAAGIESSAAQIQDEMDCMTSAVAQETTCPNYDDPDGEDGDEGQQAQPNSSQPEPEDDSDENECACSGGEAENREPPAEEGGSQAERDAQFGQDYSKGVAALGGAIVGAANAGAFGAAAAGAVGATGGVLLVVGAVAYLYFVYRERQAREARIGGNRSCAAFGQGAQQSFVTLPAPGGEPGRPLATCDVVTQCMCNARAPEERHRLFPGGDRCGGSASEAQCAITPLGPDDRPRPECVGYLRTAGGRRVGSGQPICATALCLEPNASPSMDPSGRCVCEGDLGISPVVNPLETLAQSCQARIQCPTGEAPAYGALGCGCP